MAFFNFNGSQLSYQTFGNPSNPALLLLHGNNGSQHDFKRHVTYLVPDFYVITQDARGHGQSTSNTDHLTYSLLAQDVEALRQELHITHWHIVGYSDGANLALRYTLDFPGHTDTMVLNAPNLTLPGVQAPVMALATGIDWLLRRTRYLSKFLHARWLQTQLMFESPHISKADLRLVPNRTLVLVGQFDFIKRQHSENIANSLPNGQLMVVKFRSHLFIQVSPHAFTKIVRQFIKELFI